jgi:hypothetical protein
VGSNTPLEWRATIDAPAGLDVTLISDSVKGDFGFGESVRRPFVSAALEAKVALALAEAPHITHFLGVGQIGRSPALRVPTNSPRSVAAAGRYSTVSPAFVNASAY